ncbi:hypothetical protein VB002_02665 [Campylobacter concisus]
MSENRIIIDELETIKERLENGFKAIYGENFRARLINTRRANDRII